MRLPLDKSTPAVDIGDPGGYAGKLVSDDEALYFLVGLATVTLLRKLSIADPVGTITTLAVADDSMGTAFPYGDDVYWTMDNAGRIMRSPKTPGESVILVENQVAPNDITVDAEAVYWSNGGNYAEESNGTVLKMRRP